jgi:CBS domain-containing protein
LIIEDVAIKGLVSELAYLDEVTTKLGFVRWQWEYTRATYDLKIEEKAENADYYLRVNTRSTQGRLESPYAVLVLEDAYIGKATFPHGLDYDSPIPEQILKLCRHKLFELQRELSDVKLVKEIMTKDFITATLQDSLHDIAIKMKDHNIGFIPVVEGKILLGVITDRDLAIRGYADHQDEAVTVEKVLSKEVRTILPTETVEVAAKIMAKEQIRRLPVVLNGELLGIVTLGDMASHKGFEITVGEALAQISLPI